MCEKRCKMKRIILYLVSFVFLLPLAMAFSINLDCTDSVADNGDVDCDIYLVFDSDTEEVNPFQFKVSTPAGFTEKDSLMDSSKYMTWISLSNDAVVAGLVTDDTKIIQGAVFDALAPRGKIATIHLAAGTTSGNIGLIDKVPDFTSDTEQVTVGGDGGTSCTDADGDGYGVCPNCGTTNGCSYDGDDCNDDSGDANPGKSEVHSTPTFCTDSLDNDCDTLVDHDDPGCVTCGDGIKDTGEVCEIGDSQACTMPDTSTGTQDCVNNAGVCGWGDCVATDPGTPGCDDSDFTCSWDPDPCTAGQTQTQTCTLNPGVTCTGDHSEEGVTQDCPTDPGSCDATNIPDATTTELCAGNPDPTTADTPNTVVETCDGVTPCQYHCQTGMHFDNDECRDVNGVMTTIQGILEDTTKNKFQKISDIAKALMSYFKS